MIDYSHGRNSHSVDGARAALRYLFPDEMPASLLDVGCGAGTWLKAASERGAVDILGIDGVASSVSGFSLKEQYFKQIDLTLEWNLGRRFAVALCLEVAEHLAECNAGVLVQSLCRHADTIVFSAACPGQPGQNHVNGQWPSYWQALFNAEGFVCSDRIRWELWSDKAIEPWYRQNVFMAVKDPTLAGQEDRMRQVVHPEIFERVLEYYSGTVTPRHRDSIERGLLPIKFYLTSPVVGLTRKVLNRLFPRHHG